MILAEITIGFLSAIIAFIPLQDNSNSFQGIVVAADSVTPDALDRWKKAELNVTLNLSAGTDETNLLAANQIQTAGMEVGYFIEVGRCPELADAHPEWMASLQGHPEWRRLFPEFPVAGKNQVVKNYPWVPVFYREAFDAHCERIRKLLDGKPAAKRIWLNDIQGGPSACGCGHPLCRWIGDYGPVKTGTSLGDTAPAEFVQAIRKLSPGAEVIPVLTTECELEDREHECAGVNCFAGICWKAFSKQLAAIDADSSRIGIACFYREFDRDLPRYGGEGGWIKTAIQSLEVMPPKREGRAVRAEKLIAVLQGWNVDEDQIQSQISMARESGSAGWLLVTTPVSQAWEPRLLDYDPEKIKKFSDNNPATHDHDHNH